MNRTAAAAKTECLPLSVLEERAQSLEKHYRSRVPSGDENSPPGEHALRTGGLTVCEALQAALRKKIDRGPHGNRP